MVYVKGTSKLLLELQLHLEPIYHLKTEVGANTDGTGKTGHERYVAFRTLKERADRL